MSYDEKALRRPDFQADSVAIELADRQIWFFPKPYLVLYPKIENGRVIGMGSATHFGPDFEAIMDAINSAADGKISYRVFFPLPVFLLNFNYNLPDDAFASLLSFTAGDDAESLDRFQKILDVALGVGPKPSAAGDDSASSSSAA